MYHDALAFVSVVCNAKNPVFLSRFSGTLPCKHGRYHFHMAVGYEVMSSQNCYIMAKVFHYWNKETCRHFLVLSM